MSRYTDPAWCKSMQIKYDFNNMMDSRINPDLQEGKFSKKVKPISAKEISDLVPTVNRAWKSLEHKWGRPSRMLAWSKLPTSQKTVVADILATAARIASHYENFVVLGIGGSALGPIAIQQALNHLHYNDLPSDRRPGPRLFVEDNVDPERMAALLDVIDVKKTAFNIITKSGSTSETMAQTLIVFDLLKKAAGEEKFAKQIFATTDRRKGNLIKIADDYGIKTFVIPDGVGGRYSELCPVGLLPAAVCGIDIQEMLSGAAYMEELCQNTHLSENPGWMAGMIAYLTMQKGKNIQVMMPYSDALKYMADWYAQLWAESLGKKFNARKKVVHTGQTPVKALGVTDQHSQVQLYSEGPFDKVITFLAVQNYREKVSIPGGFEDIPDVSFLGGHTLNELIQSEQLATEMALSKAGKINQTILLPEINPFTIGQLLYFFQIQTAVCGELMGIDAYDQPGVEEGKNLTYALLGRPGYEKKREEVLSQPHKNPQYII